MERLPADLWICIFVEFLGLSDTCLPTHLMCVCRRWHEFFSSKGFLSLCTLRLLQADLVRLQLCHRHFLQCTTLKHCNKKRTPKESFIVFLTEKFCGSLCLETQLIKRDLNSGRSCLALELIIEILISLTSPKCSVKQFVWNDFSFAHPTRRLADALLRNLKMWGWNQSHISSFLQSCQWYKCKQKKMGRCLLEHSKYLKDFHSTHLAGCQHTLGVAIGLLSLRTSFFLGGKVTIPIQESSPCHNCRDFSNLILPDSSPSSMNEVVIFPLKSGSNKVTSHKPKQCRCTIVWLFESLLTCWLATCRFLQENRKLSTLCLRGVVLNELNQLFDGPIDNVRKTRSLSNTPLVRLSTSFPFLNRIECSTLRVLDASGSIHQLIYVQRALMNAAAHLVTLKLQVNPSPDSVHWNQYASASFDCLSSNPSVTLSTTVNYPDLHSFRLIWAAHAPSLIVFLNTILAPQLRCCKIEQIYPQPFECNETLQQKLLKSIISFVTRNGGKLGNLNQLHIDSKEIDRYLQQQEFQNENFEKEKIKFPGLQILATSATFFYHIVSISDSLKLWHCIRLAPMYKSAVLGQSTLRHIVNQVCISINSQSSIDRLVLPAVPIAFIKLSHIRKLKISGDSFAFLRLIQFQYSLNQLEELLIITFCQLSVLKTIIKKCGLNLKSLKCHGGISGTDQTFIEILNGCQNLEEIEIPVGAYLSHFVLNYLYKRNLIPVNFSPEGNLKISTSSESLEEIVRFEIPNFVEQHDTTDWIDLYWKNCGANTKSQSTLPIDV